MSVAQTDAGGLNGGSLTSYKAAASGGQGILPSYAQRAGSIGFGGGEADGGLADVDTFLRTPRINALDLRFPSDGYSVTISRSYNGWQSTASNGFQGKNWFQNSRRELVRGTNAASNDMLYMVVDANRVMEFQNVGGSSTVFVGVNGTLATAKVTTDGSGNPGTIEIRDLSGYVWTFFDFDGDAQGAQGQLWKVTNADGNGTTAYVGTSSSMTDALAAFEQDSGVRTARVNTFIDSSDRRFAYTYTTAGGAKRLTSVVASIKTGGTWASPTGVSEVGRVEYEYYDGVSDTSNGNAGDLKWATVTMPLSTGSSLESKTYYRYTVTSPTSLLRLVVGPEGVRKYVGTITSASDSTLKPYTTHFFEYDSGAKTLSKVTLNGECGCSAGSMNGEHTLTSSVNGSFGGSLANSSYDNSGNWSSTGWYARTIITRPDASAVAVYFDETGQGLGRVVGVSNAFSGSNWAMKLRRDSVGRVTHAYSTAAISGYAHSTGAMTTTTGGLVNWRVWSSDSKIPYASTAQQVDDDDESASDAPITIIESAYSPLSITITDGTNTARLSRSNASSSGNYPTAGGSVATTSYSRTYWSGSSIWAAKKTTVTLPTTSHAYAPTSITSETYTDDKGRVIFTKDAVGKWTYSKFNSLGQLVKSIDDVKSSGDSDAVAAASTFGVSLPATGFQLITQYAYDNQGRLTDTTMPDGRVSRSYYTKLGDGRTVTLSVPSVSGGTFTGPVSYDVGNLASKREASGIIGLTGGSTSTVMSSWVSESSTDVMSAVSSGIGSLKSLSVNLYDSSGSKVSASRSFFSLAGGSYGSSNGTDHFDETTYVYDGMGRTIKATDATGTITATTYDSIGRFSSSAIGTNDSLDVNGDPTPANNMTTVQAVVYDGGSVGNNHVTSLTIKVDSNAANDRTTSTIYDYRGRAIVQVNPLAPHEVSKYDNLGRVIASGAYSSSSGLTASTDPTSTTTNRVALSETTLDVRGHAYQYTRHEIVQGSGTSNDTLTTNAWIDAVGRVIKSNASQLTKTFYDTLGRATNRFVLAKDNDSAYSDADDVSGDYVLEEHQKLYNATDGTLEMSVAILRHPKDTSTTGGLDAVNDAIDIVAVGNANFKGRASISSFYYDSMDRQIATVELGTNGSSTYTRSSDGTVGTRSDTRLISETAYLPEGRVDYTLDPKNIKTKATYDAAGRTLSTIANYVDGMPGGGTNGDQDQTTRHTYSRGRLATLTADLPGTTDDQTTIYTYGVVKTGTLASTIASNRLLRQTEYSDSKTKFVTFAYNAVGQQIGTTDQSLNTITTTYDNLGRETRRAVTALSLTEEFNGEVRRIDTVYDSTRGLTQSVTQYDHPSAGNVTDQVLFLYDDWGNNTHFYQDVDSAMNVASGASSSGRTSFLVQNTYAKVSSSGTAPMLRRTVQASPWFTGSSREIVYGYGSSGGINDSASRVETVTVGSSSGTQVASYQYLGSSQLVGTKLDQPAVETAIFTEASGVHTYGDFDNFGRVKNWDWARTGSTNTLADSAIVYDRASNILSVTDDTHQRDVSGVTKNIYDAVYTNDDLGRLIKAESGNMVSGAIQSGTKSRYEDWTLSLTGNWTNDKFDNNGDGDYTDANERDATNTFDKANKYTARNAKTAPATGKFYYNTSMQYEAIQGGLAGDMRGYFYDAFGRLMVSKADMTDGSSPLTVRYRYNGLGYRIMEQRDANANGTLTNDERMYFAYDTRWRPVATFRDTDADPKEAFIYHNAGIVGMGGSSYIDSVILRDKDANTAWTGVSDGTLDERRYLVQNWRVDVTTMLNTSGEPVEWYRYTAYGQPMSHPIADVNGDGTVDATDASIWDDLYAGSNDPSLVWLNSDINRDDVFPDGNDDTFFYAQHSAASSANPTGYDRQSAYGLRKGYAGYEWDDTLAMWHVRHRVLDSKSGKWTRRDPLGYVDGINDLGYVNSRPSLLIDSMGLAGCQPGSHVNETESWNLAPRDMLTLTASVTASNYGDWRNLPGIEGPLQPGHVQQRFRRSTATGMLARFSSDLRWGDDFFSVESKMSGGTYQSSWKEFQRRVYMGADWQLLPSQSLDGEDLPWRYGDIKSTEAMSIISGHINTWQVKCGKQAPIAIGPKPTNLSHSRSGFINDSSVTLYVEHDVKSELGPRACGIVQLITNAKATYEVQFSVPIIEWSGGIDVGVPGGISGGTSWTYTSDRRTAKAVHVVGRVTHECKCHCP